MNFLKITGLVIGTGSIAGGMGAGIYYGVNSKNAEIENINKTKSKENQNTKFNGKLVFEKKVGNDSNYEIKLLSNDKYNIEVDSFDSDKDENEKYADINTVIDISYALNIQQAKNKLQEIFGIETTLESAKTKIISEKVIELKDLFGTEIYESLKSKFNS